jgi:hypothetical protein
MRHVLKFFNVPRYRYRGGHFAIVETHQTVEILSEAKHAIGKRFKIGGSMARDQVLTGSIHLWDSVNS